MRGVVFGRRVIRSFLFLSPAIPILTSYSIPNLPSKKPKKAKKAQRTMKKLDKDQEKLVKDVSEEQDATKAEEKRKKAEEEMVIASNNIEKEALPALLKLAWAVCCKDLEDTVVKVGCVCRDLIWRILL